MGWICGSSIVLVDLPRWRGLLPLLAVPSLLLLTFLGWLCLLHWLAGDRFLSRTFRLLHVLLLLPVRWIYNSQTGNNCLHNRVAHQNHLLGGGMHTLPGCFWYDPGAGNVSISVCARR